MTVGKEGKTDVGNGGVATPVGGGLPTIKPWCMEAQTTKASTLSQLNTLAAWGPCFTPCLSRCICGLQGAGL